MCTASRTSMRRARERLARGRARASARSPRPAARGSRRPRPGAFNQAASVSSPAGVAAMESSSKSEPLSEQVEIVGVEVMVVAEAIARFTGADPAILDPCDAPLVERDGAAAAVRARKTRSCRCRRYAEQDDGASRNQADAPPRRAATASSTAAPNTASRV